MLRVKYQNGLKCGDAILTENGKEYFVEYGTNGKEIIEKRKRTFEGVRLMIVGCENVGKTSFKTRLMGVSKNKENRSAYKEVQNEKKEEEMTHGVNIYR